jgi:hypothetical protein
MRPALLVCAAGVALLAAGCPDNTATKTVELYTVTVAPPARKANLVSNELDHRVELSRGVALAIGCWDSCKGSCESPTFEITDATIADVRPVFRASGGYPTWVLVAKTAGMTQLRVATACAEQVYGLTVADDQP